MIDINEAALDVVSDHLDQHIEFCNVYEDERFENFNPDIQRAIHDRANELLAGLAEAIREGEIDLGYF